MNKKEKLILHFQEISELYLKLNDPIRAASFSKTAISILENVKEKEKSITIQDFYNIPQVGKSSLVVITEFLKTGTSTRLKELKLQMETGVDSLTLNSIQNKIKSLKEQVDHEHNK